MRALLILVFFSVLSSSYHVTLFNIGTDGDCDCDSSIYEEAEWTFPYWVMEDRRFGTSFNGDLLKNQGHLQVWDNLGGSTFFRSLPKNQCEVFQNPGGGCYTSIAYNETKRVKGKSCHMELWSNMNGKNEKVGPIHCGENTLFRGFRVYHHFVEYWSFQITVYKMDPVQNRIPEYLFVDPQGNIVTTLYLKPIPKFKPFWIAVAVGSAATVFLLAVRFCYKRFRFDWSRWPIYRNDNTLTEFSPLV